MGHFKLTVILLALVGVFGFFPERAFSQTPLEVEKLSGLDGISGQAKEVKVDAKGNLWVLSDSEILKYTSGEIQTFNRFKGLPAETGKLNTLLVDSNNTIWVGTDSGLLSLTQRGTFESASESQIKIEQLIEDGKGSLRMVNEKGVWGLEETEINLLAGFAENQRVNDLETAGNSLLVATSKGLFILSSGGDFKKIPLPGYQVLDIRSVLSHGDGFLLGTQNEGLLELSSNNSYLKKIYALPYSSRQVAISDLSSDPSGKVYVATEGDGLVILDKDLKLWGHYGEKSEKSGMDERVKQLFLDSFNRFWICTGTGEIYYLNLQQQFFDLVANDPQKYSSLGNNFTTAIEEDENGNVWFGTKAGISIWKKRSDSWQHIRNLSFSRRFDHPDVVKDLQADGEHMWVATFNDGVYKVNINTLLRAHYSSETQNNIGSKRINAVQLDRSNNIWVASEETGLVQIKADGTIRQFSWPGIKTLAWSRTGNLLAAGEAGVYIISPERSRIDTIRTLAPKAGDLPYLDINSIRESANGKIILATEGAGVVVYDPEEDAYQVIGTSSGLASDYVESLEVFGRNEIWAGTTKGLSYFKLASEPEVRNYGEQDGLVSSRFTGTALRFDNRLAFGTSRGVQIFNPAEVKDLTRPLPQVNISEIRSGSPGGKFREEPLGSPLHLKGDDHFMRVSFAGSQPGNQKPLLFSWRLKGFDSVWSSPQAQKSAIFSQLAPGKYTFEVKGLASDGSWSEVVGIPVEVNTPWYFSSGSYLAIGTALLLFITLLFFLSNMIRKRRKKVMQTTILTRLNQEFATPLHIILSTLDNIAEDEVLKNKNRLTVVTDRLRELMDPIMNLHLSGLKKNTSLNITKIGVTPYLNDLLADIQPLLKEKHLEIILNNQWNRTHLVYDVIYLNKILFNVLSSSIKYSTHEGKIIMNLIGTNKGDLKLQITDNGLGMPEKERKIVKDYFRNGKKPALKEGQNIHNLLAVKDFLDKAGGAILFESSRNEGTTFTLILKNYSKSASANQDQKEESVEKKVESPVESERTVDTYSQPTHPSEPIPEVKTVLPSEPAVKNQTVPPRTTILVVEEEGELTTETEALKQLGALFTAQGIIEAFQIALTEKPDCIITSWGRPGTDASVLLKALQKNKELEGVVIYVLYSEEEFSGVPDLMNQQNLVPVKKPEDPGDLVRLIAEKQHIALETPILNSNLAERNSKLLKKESDEDIVSRLQKLIIENVEESSFSIEELSKAIGVRRNALESVIEDWEDVTLEDFIIETKLDYARSLIIKGDPDLSEVARKAGFKNKDIFFFLYKKHFGFMPGRIMERK